MIHIKYLAPGVRRRQLLFGAMYFAAGSELSFELSLFEVWGFSNCSSYEFFCIICIDRGTRGPSDFLPQA